VLLPNTQNGRHLTAAVDAGDQQQAELIHETGLQESPVDAPAAFEQQRAYAEMLAEQGHRLGQIDRGLAADHVGDAFLPEQVQVVCRGLLAQNADEAVVAEAALGPP
jgi:hypothetical protein